MIEPQGNSARTSSNAPWPGASSARTLETIQERLYARCGLYIFTFCDLSRSKYERLRNTEHAAQL